MRIFLQSSSLVGCFFFFLIVSTTESATIRKVGGGLQIQADVSELPRDLQEQAAASEDGGGGGGGSTFGGGYDNIGNAKYEDDSDASLLNQLLAFFLPYINEAFQSLVPDPLVLDLADTFQLNNINVLGCEAGVGFSYELGTIQGLSKMSIDRLQVIGGTEKVEAKSCFETLWSGVFDMTISSTGIFSVDDLVGGFRANACGYSFDDTVTGGINTHQPIMRGAVKISGDLFSNVATIDIADIFEALDVDYDHIEGFLNDVPPAWNLVISDATTELSQTMKDELKSTVEPRVKPKARESMEGQQIQVSTAQFVKLQSGFVRNGVRRSIRRAYDNTANFFGSAVSVLGFGGSDVDDGNL